MEETEKMAEMGEREKEELREHQEEWDLRVHQELKEKQVPKENPVPRSPIRKTGNSARGKILMMGETMD